MSRPGELGYTSGVPVVLEPLGPWPASLDRPPRASSATSGYVTTMSDTGRELRHLGARRGVFELDVDPGTLRQDGTDFRAQGWRKVRSGRVRLRVEMPGDRADLVFTASGLVWKSTSRRMGGTPPFELAMRNIYLTLNGLRAIERWGVVERPGQAFEGFAALPPGRPMPGGMPGGDGSSAGRDQAWAIAELVELTGLPASTPVGDLLRAARYHATTDTARSRLDDVRAVFSGQDALREREEFEEFRRQRSITDGRS